METARMAADTITKTYRIPREINERITAYRERFEARMGIALSEAQAVAALLKLALDAAEAEDAEARKGKRK
jgi:hypothetical protein